MSDELDSAGKDTIAALLDDDKIAGRELAPWYLIRAMTATNLDLFNRILGLLGEPEITPAQYKANVRGKL